MVSKMSEFFFLFNIHISEYRECVLWIVDFYCDAISTKSWVSYLLITGWKLPRDGWMATMFKSKLTYDFIVWQKTECFNKIGSAQVSFVEGSEFESWLSQTNDL